MLQKEVEFGDLFIGFRQNTVQIIIYGFITTALIQAGLEINMLIGITTFFRIHRGITGCIVSHFQKSK